MAAYTGTGGPRQFGGGASSRRSGAAPTPAGGPAPRPAENKTATPDQRSTLESFYMNMDPAGRSYDEGRNFQTFLGNPALSNFYKVSLNLSGSATDTETISGYLRSAGVWSGNNDARRFDFLCCETLIPGTALDAFSEMGSIQGIEEFFPGRRIYTDISLSFYVSADYLILRLFQEWINFINPMSALGGIVKTPNPAGYSALKNGFFFHRYRYPDSYKIDMSINKFERDMSNSMTYTFIDAFPVNISSIPLSYDQAQILKITVDFKYTRYIITSHGDSQTSTALSFGRPKETSSNSTASTVGYSAPTTTNPAANYLSGTNIGSDYIKEAFQNAPTDFWNNFKTLAPNTQQITANYTGASK